jgi:hypothetical protein
MKITTMDILKMFGVIMLGVVILLLLLTFIGQPHLGYISNTSSNQTTRYPYCAYEHGEFQIAFYVIELLLLCYGVSLCWKIKDIPDAINESQAIAFAMAVIAGVCYMCFPIILSEPPSVNQIIAAVGFFVAILVILACVFYPKAKILLAGKDLMKDLTIGYGTAGGKKVTPMNGEEKSDVRISKTGSNSPLMKSDASDIRPAALVISNSSTSDQFPYPTLNQIPGNRQEKLHFISGYIEYWTKLKTTVEQQILMLGSGPSQSNSHLSQSQSHKSSNSN